MGKISAYFEQRRQEEEERQRRETVAAFAKELNKTSETLMAQLHDAGIKKVSETDPLTEVDKQALLRYLQKLHGTKARRKKLTLVLETEEQRLMKAVAAQENGAEWACLAHLAGLEFWGNKVDPDFQKVINLIVAKSVIFEALPMKKLGRPKSEKAESLGREIAQKYWDLRDGGTSYAEAVQHLAEKFHKDERHIMRLAEKHKESVGLTVESRQMRREFFNWPQRLRSIFKESFDSLALEMLDSLRPSMPEFTTEDYAEYFDEQLTKAATPHSPTDTK